MTWRSPATAIATAIVVSAPGAALGQASGHESAHGSAAKVARPTSPQSPFAFSSRAAQRHAGSSVVVHYVTSGADKPRGGDRDGDRVPDYVELAAAEADAALAFYANPVLCSRTSCKDAGLEPFRRPRPDRAGPDARPDVYIKAGLAGQGLAISPLRGEGGSFVMIAPNLETRRRGPRNGAHMILAHELFHLVEFAYLPRGAPRWISEGVANRMGQEAYDASNIRNGVRTSTDLTVDDQFTYWLRQPWLPVYSDEFECPRCYGTAAWWQAAGSADGVLQRLFELLARRPANAGLGLDALDRAIRERGPVLGERSFTGAMGEFWFDMFRYFQPRMLRPLQVGPAERTVGPAAPNRSSPPPPGLLGPTSADFVPLQVPSASAGVRVTFESDAGPEPRIALFVGNGRFRENSGRITRQVRPSRIESRSFQGRPGKAIVFEARFVHRDERNEVVLMIASRRLTKTPYRLRYSSFSTGGPSNEHCGLTDQNRSFCFELSENGSSVTNVTTEVVVQCNPTRTFVFPVTMPNDVIPVSPSRTFAATLLLVRDEGRASGTVAVRGTIQGIRARGTIQLTGWSVVVDGTRYACSSPLLNWSAERTS